MTGSAMSRAKHPEDDAPNIATPSVGSYYREQFSLTRTPDGNARGYVEGGRRKSTVWDGPDQIVSD
jgi:hypothetical protein